MMRRLENDIPLVNAFYVNHRPIYRAASQCFVQEASPFHGWVNRERWYQWLQRKIALQLGDMRSC